MDMPYMAEYEFLDPENDTEPQKGEIFVDFPKFRDDGDVKALMGYITENLAASLPVGAKFRVTCIKTKEEETENGES